MAKMTPKKTDNSVEEYDVEKVAIGESSTEYGGKNAGGKAKTNYTYENLQTDRNINPSNEGHGGKV